MLQFSVSVYELKQLNPMKFENIKLSQPDLLVITYYTQKHFKRLQSKDNILLLSFLITQHNNAIENCLYKQNENIYDNIP